MKQVTQAKEAIVSAAADTKRAVVAVGALAVVALVVAVLALGAALRGRRAARV
jgi:hypothetical protein